MKIITKKVKVYVEKCNDCDLEIEGSTIASLDWNMTLHKDKHARELK